MIRGACEWCDSGTVTQKVECTGCTFETTDGNVCTSGDLNVGGTLLIMSAGLISYCTLNMPSDSLITTVGLWIQDKLPGNVSLVLGAIEMFSTVPTMHSRMHMVNPWGCLVELWRIADAWAVPYASRPKRHNVCPLTTYRKFQYAQALTKGFLDM